MNQSLFFPGIAILVLNAIIFELLSGIKYWHFS